MVSSWYTKFRGNRFQSLASRARRKSRLEKSGGGGGPLLWVTAKGFNKVL